MPHYVGVVVPLETGGWRALFPDIPHCSVERESLDLTILSAANELAKLVGIGRPLPPPRDFAEIKSDGAWAADSRIDWSKSVVTMIRCAGKARNLSSKTDRSFQRL